MATRVVPEVMQYPQAIIEETLFDWVPIIKMLVAPYGRALSERRIQEMSKSYDTAKVGVILLSYRHDTDTYAILDGSHRKAAAALTGVTSLPARIYIDLTYEKEAELYLAFATVNEQTALDRFRARIEAKEPTALHIAAILDEYQLSVGITSRREENGVIAAVAQLDHIYRLHGAGFFGEIIGVLSDAFGYSPQAWTAQTLSAMAGFWLRYRDTVDRDSLLERMKILTASGWRGQATQMQAAHKRLHSIEAWVEVLVEVYNTRRRNGRLSGWERAYSETGKALFAARPLAGAAATRHAEAEQRKQLSGSGDNGVI